MLSSHPVRTETTSCQDCYRCVRECPVQAIRVQAGHAEIQPERCVACGRCLGECPQGAKVARRDRTRAEHALATGQAVVSLAPSWPAAFPDLHLDQVVAGLRALGFAAVGLTAAGAQEHSSHVAKLLAENPDAVWYSSACPAAVAWLQRHGDSSEQITPFDSPLLTHCRLLQERLGAETQVVFVGPCAAKKFEADRNPNLLAAAIGFDELADWWAGAGIEPEQLAIGPNDRVLVEGVAEGALYPIEGGMLASMARDPAGDAAVCTCTGIDALAEIAGSAVDGGLFVEALACAGGCVGGPLTGGTHGVRGRRRIVSEAAVSPVPLPRRPTIAISPEVAGDQALPAEMISSDELAQALARIGKHSQADMLDCRGCGYAGCEAFAKALVTDRAEPAMCLGYTRRQAQRKANALLEAMPAAAVIVDHHGRVVEFNRPFADLVLAITGEPVSDQGVVADGFPLQDLCEPVLRNGARLDRTWRGQTHVVTCTLFPIERGRLAGGILRDITQPALQREEVVQRTRSVIDQQLTTVQQIARLLGESAAQSEASLSSIIEAFGGDHGGRGAV